MQSEIHAEIQNRKNDQRHQEGAKRFRFTEASEEMLAFIECNWNHGEIIEHIFCKHCDQNEGVESVAAEDLIGALFKRGNCSGWKFACIAGSFASASYLRGRGGK